MQSIAIFGGTFDPIHYGHLYTSMKIQNVLNFNHYYFLPCKIPLLKTQPLTTTDQRVNMLRLAVKNSEFEVDLREILRATPSFIVDTLYDYRLEHPDASLTLIIGYDAFISLPKWHQWKKILGLTNLLVMNRKGSEKLPIPPSIDLLLKGQIKVPSELATKKAGSVLLFNAGDYLISSTKIREQIKQGGDVADLIPKSVYNYIKEFGLYQ